MPRPQLSSALRAARHIDQKLRGDRIQYGNVRLPLLLASDQLRWLLARSAVQRRRYMHHPIDRPRHGSRRSLPVAPAALPSALCRIRLRLTATERRSLALLRPPEILVLSFEALDSSQQLSNLSIAISELPLKLRDPPILVVFRGHPTLPSEGYSSALRR